MKTVEFDVNSNQLFINIDARPYAIDAINTSGAAVCTFVPDPDQIINTMRAMAAQGCTDIRVDNVAFDFNGEYEEPIIAIKQESDLVKYSNKVIQNVEHVLVYNKKGEKTMNNLFEESPIKGTAAYTVGHTFITATKGNALYGVQFVRNGNKSRTYWYYGIADFAATGTKLTTINHDGIATIAAKSGSVQRNRIFASSLKDIAAEFEISVDKSLVYKINPNSVPVVDGNGNVINLATAPMPANLAIYPEFTGYAPRFKEKAVAYAAKCFSHGARVALYVAYENGKALWEIFQAHNLAEQTEARFNILLKEFCTKNGMFAELPKTYATYDGKSLSKLNELFNTGKMSRDKLVQSIKKGFDAKTGDTSDVLAKRLYWNKDLSKAFVDTITTTFWSVGASFRMIEDEQYHNTLAGRMMDKSSAERNADLDEIDHIDLEELLSDEGKHCDNLDAKSWQKVAHLLARFYNVRNVLSYAFHDIADDVKASLEDVLSDAQRAELREADELRGYLTSHQVDNYVDEFVYLANTERFDNCKGLKRVLQLLHIIEVQYPDMLAKHKDEMEDIFLSRGVSGRKAVQASNNYKVLADLYEGKSYVGLTYTREAKETAAVKAEKLRLELAAMDKNDPQWIAKFNQYAYAAQEADRAAAEAIDRENSLKFLMARMEAAQDAINKMAASGHVDTEALDAQYVKMQKYADAINRLNDLSDEDFGTDYNSYLTAAQQQQVASICRHKADYYRALDEQQKAAQAAWKEAMSIIPEPPKGYRSYDSLFYRD